MTLDEIETGTMVAVDANILIYHFSGQSRACERFLRRCQMGELRAVMPAHVFLETLHRRMMLEAVNTGAVTAGNIARKMAEHPDRVRRLSHSHADLSLLQGMGIEVIPTTPTAVQRASNYCLSYGLMASGAAMLAVIDEAGVFDLASADVQLKAVSTLRVYAPGDIDAA